MYEETKKKYWLPGRHEYKASMPIPPNKASKVRGKLAFVLFTIALFQRVNYL